MKVVDLPAGPAVRLRGESSLDYHVRMPGEAGYLHLAFSLPLSGTEAPWAVCATPWPTRCDGSESFLRRPSVKAANDSCDGGEPLGAGEGGEHVGGE